VKKASPFRAIVLRRAVRGRMGAKLRAGCRFRRATRFLGPGDRMGAWLQSGRRVGVFVVTGCAEQGSSPEAVAIHTEARCVHNGASRKGRRKCCRRCQTGSGGGPECEAFLVRAGAITTPAIGGAVRFTLSWRGLGGPRGAKIRRAGVLRGSGHSVRFRAAAAGESSASGTADRLKSNDGQYCRMTARSRGGTTRGLYADVDTALFFLKITGGPLTGIEALKMTESTGRSN